MKKKKKILNGILIGMSCLLATGVVLSVTNVFDIYAKEESKDEVSDTSSELPSEDVSIELSGNFCYLFSLKASVDEEVIINGLKNTLKEMESDGFKFFVYDLYLEDSILYAEKVYLNSVDDFNITYKDGIYHFGISEEDFNFLNESGIGMYMMLQQIPQSWGIVLPDNYVYKNYGFVVDGTECIQIHVTGSGVFESEVNSQKFSVELSPSLLVFNSD